MKKFIKAILVMCMFLMIPTSKIEAKNNIKETRSNMIYKFNKDKFIEFVEFKENFKVTDKGIKIFEIENSNQIDILIVDSRDKNNINIISSNTAPESLMINQNSLFDNYFTLSKKPYYVQNIILGFIGEKIVEIILDQFGKWACNGLSDRYKMDDYCNYVVQQAILSLISEGKYEVTKYFYKDPNCVPPHSYMCNTAPYAYYKYVTRRIF